MFKNSEIGRNCKYTKFLKNLVLNNDEDTSLPTETRWICLPKVDTVKDTIRSSADVFRRSTVRSTLAGRGKSSTFVTGKNLLVFFINISAHLL